MKTYDEIIREMNGLKEEMKNLIIKTDTLIEQLEQENALLINQLKAVRIDQVDLSDTVMAKPIQWAIYWQGAETEYYIVCEINDTGDDYILYSHDDRRQITNGTYSDCFDKAHELITKDYKYAG